MSIAQKLRERLKREQFHPTWLSMMLTPTYIIRRGLLVSIRKFAPLISGSVLDFGCGSKPYEFLFEKAQTYVGVDLETTGHNHADSRIDVFYDGKTLPFEDKQFHCVVSFEVFEHVFNLAEVLSEIRRVTKSGGYLLISVPFAWHEHEQPYDFARYTSFGLAYVLSQSGYEVLESEKSTTHLLATFQMFNAYLTLIRPRSKVFRLLRQIALIFPITVLAYCTNALLPKRHEFYCNLVILARKP